MEKRLIWDIPTRLFHWLLVACILAQYLTAEVFHPGADFIQVVLGFCRHNLREIQSVPYRAR